MKLKIKLDVNSMQSTNFAMLRKHPHLSTLSTAMVWVPMMLVRKSN